MTEKHPDLFENEWEEALSVRGEAPVEFPAEREAEMMAFIAERADEIQTSATKIIGFPVWSRRLAQAAAALLVLFGTFQAWRGSREGDEMSMVQLEKKNAPSGSSIVPAIKRDRPDPVDINRDGRVDVIDAYLLAVELESGRTLSLERDVNRDGKINQLDVQYIATRAVDITLEKS